MLAFVGCDDDDKKVEPKPKDDKIEIAPESETFGSKGGTAEVIVTSSDKWTLAGDFDWVTPSALSGKDGDIVKFKVDPNETDQDKTAVYTFTVGKKQAKYTIICKMAGTVVDKISISPKEEHFDKNGGKVETIVTSSADWTLTGDYAWITPSAKSGKDGDLVSFQVDPNTEADAREAVYTFTVGKETAELKISQDGGISVQLVSEKDVTVLEAGSQIEIRLNSEMNYRELTQAIEGGDGWLTYAVTLAGSDDCTARMFFDVAPNEEYEARNAVITISAGKAQATVNVAQKAKTRLETDEEMIVVGLEKETIGIPVYSNVDYTIEIEEAAKSWITYLDKSGDMERFEIAAGDAKRQGTISFVSESKTLEVTVMQKPEAIINFAPYMGRNRAWPAWDNPVPVTNMKAFTLEALVNMTERKNANSLSTIMGIEGKFLVRVGDVGVPVDQIQVVWDSGKAGTWGNVEGKLSNANMKLAQMNQWYHVAVTFDGTTIKCYLDGKEVGTTTQDVPASVHFGVEHNDEQAPQGQQITRCFWVGYAYDNARDFKGMMSELRIWNKVLTPDEINAPNHFYQVDPNTEGLVTYWKMNEGKGNVIKDYSVYGNNLAVQSDLDWRVVSVPE